MFSVRFYVSLVSLLLLSYSSSVRAFDGSRAWRSSGSTHKELIENLYSNGLIKDQRIKQVMLQVDRVDFTDDQSQAYVDRPQSSKKPHPPTHFDLVIDLSSWLRSKCAGNDRKIFGVFFRSPSGNLFGVPCACSAIRSILSAPHMHCFGLEILKDKLRPGSSLPP